MAKVFALRKIAQSRCEWRSHLCARGYRRPARIETSRREYVRIAVDDRQWMRVNLESWNDCVIRIDITGSVSNQLTPRSPVLP